MTNSDQAFIHRSYLNEHPQVKFSNERLEFLGDSVLSLLTSTELYNRFPNIPEGKLTNLRSALVRTQNLGKISQELGFGQKLLMSKGEENGGGRENLSLLADTFEAYLGAIYLDEGLENAREFLEKHLFPMINELPLDHNLTDFKSRLQEISQQKFKVAPVYKVKKEEGPDHGKKFTIEVKIKNTTALGIGRNKQEAEQEAARIALTSIE